MNWKKKALIQNLICLLPEHISYETYYKTQRKRGALQDDRIDPFSRLQAGLSICDRIIKSRRPIKEKIFFEIGTGRRLNTPIAFWLLGASKTITVDLNPYLKKELIDLDIKKLQNQAHKLRLSLEAFDFDEKRLETLLDMNPSEETLSTILETFRIEYKAPHDASQTDLIDSNIDYHTSYTVLEHIPPSIISDIFKEGTRITKKDGLFVHFIDYSDHFSHTDQSIPRINFLKYSNRTWNIIAGNKFMYMNRYRDSELKTIILRHTNNLIEHTPEINQRCLQLLNDGQFNVSNQFKKYTTADLATDCAWFVSNSSLQ